MSSTGSPSRQAKRTCRSRAREGGWWAWTTEGTGIPDGPNAPADGVCLQLRLQPVPLPRQRRDLSVLLGPHCLDLLTEQFDACVGLRQQALELLQRCAMGGGTRVAVQGWRCKGGDARVAMQGWGAVCVDTGESMGFQGDPVLPRAAPSPRGTTPRCAAWRPSPPPLPAPWPAPPGGGGGWCAWM